MLIDTRIFQLGRAAEVVHADGTIPKEKSDFSYEEFGEKVADAVSSLAGISEPKWSEILACSTHVKLEHNVRTAPDPAVAHFERRQMFGFESPVKGRG